MLREAIKKNKLGRMEIITFPRYFKHFKEELYSSILYSEDHPILVIKVDEKISFIRKRRVMMTYKFFDNGVETTLDDIAKKIKTLIEFKVFLKGVHPRFKVVDYRGDKPYKNVNDPFKRARYIEYTAFDKKMIKKNDRKNFEPENAFNLTERQMLRYFIFKRKCKLLNLNDSALLKEKGVVSFFREGSGNFLVNEGRVFLFLKGKNYNEEIEKELFKLFTNNANFNYDRFVENDAIKVIGCIDKESLDRAFINDASSLNIEPTTVTSFTNFHMFSLNPNEFPFYAELVDDKSFFVYRKSNKSFLFNIDFNNALEAGLIEFF